MKKDSTKSLQSAIAIRGARVHNLKNIDVDIPRHKLTVVTGLSGSGKSSLAFDTILAEGQRRYIDTFSAYARSFINNGKSDRPDVDSIEGLSPVVAIDQKTTSNNPRSTVGTVTEVYDFLRLLFARVSTPYSYISGKEMVRYTQEQIFEYIKQNYADTAIDLLAPIVVDRKGHYQELFEQYRKKGYLQVYVDGEVRELVPGMRLSRYQKHYIAVLIDKLTVKEQNDQRLKDALQLALRVGDGMLDIRERKTSQIKHLSRRLMDADNGLAYPDPTPADFSFNTPRGYCTRCKGLGRINNIDSEKLFPNRNLSIKEGAIAPLGRYKKKLIFDILEQILENHNSSINTPIKDLSEETIEEILWGGENSPTINDAPFVGIASYIASMVEEEDATKEIKEWAEQYMSLTPCPVCNGARLNKIALSYKIGGYNIHDLCILDIEQLQDVVQRELPQSIPESRQKVAEEILKEILVRLSFLVNIGLGYLNLNRNTGTLSGGEAQRIRLATQIGTGLVEVLYILDEPGIGLHQRDNRKLINSLHTLRDAQNTILVVEHDRDMMLSADYIIDMGPGAGRMGGHVVFAGTPQELKYGTSLTTDYLTNKRTIPLPSMRRTVSSDNFLIIRGASGNNLQTIDVAIPLGVFVCVTGVSGSGKSSLINGTLAPILFQKIYKSQQEPLPYVEVEGMESIDKIVVVDQSPLGRTPRSNPATYTGLFAEIRNLFATTPESRARGYKPGRFSFNVKGGRCED